MKTTFHLALAVFALTSLFSVSVAYAEDNTEKRLMRSKYKQSQKAFDQGASAFRAKNYELAMTYFLRAHALVPAAMYLYNVAKSKRELGDLESARNYAQRALDSKEMPIAQPGTRQAVESFIKELDARIASQNAARFQMSFVGWTGVGLLSVGAIAWGASSFGGAALTQDMAELAQERDKATYDRSRADIEARQSFFQVTYPMGIALVVAGAGLLTWDLATRGEEPWSVALTPLPQGGAHATVTWEF